MGVSDRARIVDERRPSMRQDDLRPGVERVDAPLEQVRGVEVVVGCPLEELAAGLLDHEVVIERRAAVLRVMDVPHAGINRCIMPGDLTRPIGGAVIGDDQLEVGEGLRQEGVQGCREETLAVVNRQAKREAGYRCGGAHLATSGTAWWSAKRRSKLMPPHQRGEALGNRHTPTRADGSPQDGSD